MTDQDESVMCDGTGECFQLERDLNELTDWDNFLCSWIRDNHNKDLIEEVWLAYQEKLHETPPVNGCACNCCIKSKDPKKNG